MLLIRCRPIGNTPNSQQYLYNVLCVYNVYVCIYIVIHLAAEGVPISAHGKLTTSGFIPPEVDVPMPIHPSAGPNMVKVMSLPVADQYTVQLVPRKV